MPKFGLSLLNWSAEKPTQEIQYHYCCCYITVLTITMQCNQCSTSNATIVWCDPPYSLKQSFIRIMILSLHSLGIVSIGEFTESVGITETVVVLAINARNVGELH